MIIAPAYGRDYKSVTEANEAWHGDKDFIIVEGNYRGSYINKSDAIKYDIGIVTIVYDKRSKSFQQQVG